MLVGRMSDCLRGGYVCRQLVCSAAIFLCLISSVSAQVVNGNFSAGGTGWTTVVPGTTDSIVFTGGTMVATSNNIGGGGAGPDITTLAQQTFTAGDPGFLSYTLVSYTTTDVGDFDHPVAVIDGTRFRVATDGSLVLAAPPPLINNNNPFATPPLSGVTTLAAGSRTIAFGVRATDSIFGSGIATWDDIDFQEITLSPIAQTTNENIPLTLSGVNAPQTATNTTDTITVTLSVSDGIINLGSPGSVTITGGADGTATVTFQGTPAQINTAMNGLIYTPDLGFEGDDTLVYTASAAPSGISDTDNITITVVPGNPSITVVKSALPTANLLAGQTITYTYVVTNNGDQTISNISLLESHNGSGSTPLPGNESLTADNGTTGDSTDVDGTDSTWDVLAPGDEVTFTATYVVTQNDVDTLQ